MILIHPAYVVFVGISVVLAVAFPVARHIRDQHLRRQYYFLQGIAILGAVAGAKLSVLIGDYHWPWVAMTDWRSVLWSGRSITGALILGFLCAELAKPLIHYPMPPNDRFAALLPFTIATGRVGCLLAGCCQGLPSDSWFAIKGADGIPRYPAQIIEIIFQLAIGVAFLLMVRRGWFFGRLFSFYLIAYGVFRFLTEYIRDTPKFFGGYSGYQLLALVMMALGTLFFLKRTFNPPARWEEFRVSKLAPQPAQIALEETRG